MDPLLVGPMASVLSTVLIAAIVSSLLLGAAVVARRPRGRNQWSFALGMLAFAAEGAATYILVTATSTPEERLLWVRVWAIAGLTVPIPWGFFVAGLGRPAGARWPNALRLALAGACALAVAGAIGIVSPDAFRVSDISGPFYAIQLNWPSRYSVVLQALMTAGLLAGLESCLRTSTGTLRWRIKYLVLGLGAIFLARFFFLSQALLFQVLLAGYLTAGAATLLAGNLVVAASLVRDRLFGGDLPLSRHVLYRSALILTLGIYLFAVGGLGWLLNTLGIPEDIFWGSILIFVSAIALASVLLSENVRWRIKRFVALNFYRSKYDYREQWIAFTKRLGSLISLQELGPQLVGAVTDAIGAARGVLYLANERDGRYQLLGAVEMDRAPQFLEADAPLITALRAERRPVVIENGSAAGSTSLLGPLASLLGDGAVAVPIGWQGGLIGVMVVGPERTGSAYTLEDLEFLSTVSEQAAGAIATARLSEALAQTRAFETFHRLTSFVIHDLKNSISALSMLSQNALEHFDDPEFQRDALRTLSRTVERMKALLVKLSAAPTGTPLNLEPVDIADLALEATRLLGGSRVGLIKELARVRTVPGDPEALLKVFQNLVTNAIEAMGGEGSITVKTYEDGGWVVCAISDTGCGMSQEFLQKSLFTPFRTTKKGGWGIGLYQAKGIVEAHDGNIDASSKEGAGTTFFVRLPVERT
jgi:putative PEP-CTERM system histidine kinase